VRKAERPHSVRLFNFPISDTHSMLAQTADHPLRVTRRVFSRSSSLLSCVVVPVPAEGAPPQSLHDEVKKELLMHPKVFLPTALGHELAVGVLALMAGTAACAQPVATPEQKFSPGYLEAVSTGYENGQASIAPTAPAEGATAPVAHLSQASFLVPPTQPATTTTHPHKDKKHH